MNLLTRLRRLWGQNRIRLTPSHGMPSHIPWGSASQTPSPAEPADGFEADLFYQENAMEGLRPVPLIRQKFDKI